MNPASSPSRSVAEDRCLSPVQGQRCQEEWREASPRYHPAVEEPDRLSVAMQPKWARKRVLRRATDRLLSVAVDKSFDFWQRIGVHITPNNFYGPAPDTKVLPPSLWSGDSELVGIDLRV